MTQFVGALSRNQKVAGSFPIRAHSLVEGSIRGPITYHPRSGLGAYGRQLVTVSHINIFLSPSLPFFLSLEAMKIKMSSDEDKKRKEIAPIYLSHESRRKVYFVFKSILYKMVEIF